MSKSRQYLASFFTLCCLAIATLSQTPTATITGSVRDASGAALLGVKVVARNTQTNVERSAVTGDSGDYTIPLLSIGDYQITVEKAGFKRVVQSGIVLQVDQRQRLDFSMEIGQVSESVEVTASATLLQSDSASVGTVIDNKRVVELPLNSREFYSLALTAPRVLPPAQNSTLSFRGGFNVAGSSEVSNNFTLNGIDNNDTGINGPSFRPSIDAIQEFKLLSGSYSAEYGRNSGGQVVVTTKSGTNRFHGTGYEFIRNQVLDARNFFLRLGPGQKIPAFKRNLFGGTIGGPIKKDKTFFFFGYEGLRLRQSVTALSTVPTEAMVRGDFRGLPVRVVNPATGRDFTVPNVIDANLISPIGAALAKFYPAPSTATAANALPANNYNFNATRREDYDQISARVDHTFSAKDAVYVTYNFYDNPAFEPSNSLCGTRTLPGFGCNTGLTTQLAGVIWTHTFTSNLTNEARVGFNRLRQPRIQEDDAVDFLKTVGITNAFFGETPFNRGVPQVTVTGFSTIGGATNLPQDRRDNTFQFVDNVIWTRSAHTLKFGVDIRRFQSNLYFISQGRGIFNFNTPANSATQPTSGYNFADLLLGIPNNTSRNPRGPSTYSRTSSFNAYVQDDWKVNSRLTLNLGMRWELNTPMTEAYDTIASFDPAKNDVRPAGRNGVPRNLYKYDKTNFAPRIGFAWQPTGDGKWVVRGGGGYFYNVQPAGNGLLGMLFNFPFRLPQTFNTSNATPLRLSDPFPGPIPAVGVTPRNGSLTFTAIDQDFDNAVVYQWGLGVQRELSKNLLVEVSYLGSKGTHLPINRNLNQPTAGAGTTAQVNARRPFPDFNNITWAESVANSTYHSMEAKAERRFTAGLTFLASYTWAKSIDNSPGISTGSNASGATQNTLNLRGERGLSDFDVRHRVVASPIWELPFGKGKRWLDAGAGAAILGGWQVSGIVALQSGRPFTATLVGNVSNTLNNADRPHLIGDPKLNERTPTRWFNTCTLLANGTTQGCLSGESPVWQIPVTAFGSAGRNILTGPSFKNIDFALNRNFKIKERIGIQFRSEIFNLFNHANFNYPAAQINAPNTIGRITTAADPRQIQFGLKILF